MDSPLTIAIDGPAGAGKTTIAREVARALNVLYLDTGAMYRAAGLCLARRGVDLDDMTAVGQSAPAIDLKVRFVDGAQHVYIEDEDVSEAIRTAEASDYASKVSRSREVRARFVEMQRDIARGQSVVMDGRDIGTRVLPEATLKIFLIADPAVRAKRRYLQLKEKGAPDTYEEVLRDMLERDERDATRAESPLQKAKDAVELDTSALTPAEVCARVLDLIKNRL